MLSLALAPSDAPLTALCLGAHCDDIEIGCAGLLRVLADRYPQMSFEWAVFTNEPERVLETRAAASRLLPPGRSPTVTFEAFRASYFPAQWGAIKDCFEALKQRVSPDLILTHCLADRHQDHRLLAEMTWTAFRDHLILEYEIPKYEGDLGHPNFYVPISRQVAEHKLATLDDCFVSQHSRSWFSRDTFSAHLRMRGIECNAPDGLAEAFHARKLRF